MMKVISFFLVVVLGFNNKILKDDLIGEWVSEDGDMKEMYEFTSEGNCIGTLIDYSIGNEKEGFDTIIQFEFPYYLEKDSLFIDWSDDEENYIQSYRVIKLKETKLVIRHKSKKERYKRVL
jgi:hypothetical protein